MYMTLESLHCRYKYRSHYCSRYMASDLLGTHVLLIELRRLKCNRSIWGPITAPLRMTSSSIAADWKRFKSQYLNYAVAADLSEKSKTKRAAVFLACVGTEAYEIFQTLDFEEDDDQTDIDKVIEAFQRHCVGENNVTYERYVFNQRTQSPGEAFDVFLADQRRLVKSCEYGDVEDSILHDRIVVGVRDDSIRRKSLQRRNLGLADAIDVCIASELASKQLKVMTSPDKVNVMNTIVSFPGRSGTSRFQ